MRMKMARMSTKKLLEEPVTRHDLKGCPFCGAAPEIQFWHGGGPNKRMVSCPGDNCDVRPMVSGESEREAIARWGKRARPAGNIEMPGRRPRKRKQHELVAFVAVWAVQYQKDYGLNGLHPTHYDLIEKYGGRMDSFKRATNMQCPQEIGEVQS